MIQKVAGAYSAPAASSQQPAARFGWTLQPGTYYRYLARSPMVASVARYPLFARDILPNSRQLALGSRYCMCGTEFQKDGPESVTFG